MGRYANCADALKALANGPGEFVCHDFDTVREVVMCDAWRRLDTQQSPTFKAAIDASWADVKTSCAPNGGITPEVRPEDHAAQTETWDILNTHGKKAGVVIVDGADGSVTTCILDRCHTDFIEPQQDLRQAIVAAMQDIYPTVGYTLEKETP